VNSGKMIVIGSSSLLGSLEEKVKHDNLIFYPLCEIEMVKREIDRDRMAVIVCFDNGTVSVNYKSILTLCGDVSYVFVSPNPLLLKSFLELGDNIAVYVGENENYEDVLLSFRDMFLRKDLISFDLLDLSKLIFSARYLTSLRLRIKREDFHNLENEILGLVRKNFKSIKALALKVMGSSDLTLDEVYLIGEILMKKLDLKDDVEFLLGVGIDEGLLEREIIMFASLEGE